MVTCNNFVSNGTGRKGLCGGGGRGAAHFLGELYYCPQQVGNLSAISRSLSGAPETPKKCGKEVSQGLRPRRTP